MPSSRFGWLDGIVASDVLTLVFRLRRHMLFQAATPSSTSTKQAIQAAK